MKPLDQHIMDLSDRARDQAEALSEKMNSVIHREDDDGEPDTDRLCGIGRDTRKRAVLIFADPEITNRRSLVYVDAILDLARILNTLPQDSAEEL